MPPIFDSVFLFLRKLFLHNQNNPTQNKSNTWDCHTIAQGFIPCRVRCPIDQSPAIRETLQPLTLQRSETADQISVYLRLADQISCIFILSGAFCASDFAFLEFIHSLAAIDRMPVCCIQGVTDIFLIAKPIPAIFTLPVNDIPGNTIAVRFLRNQRKIIAACAASG